MSPYNPIPSGPGGGGSQASSPRRQMSFRLGSHSRRQSSVPDPNEMDRAFDDPDDDVDEDHRLLGDTSHSQHAAEPTMPGDYDFNRDYFLPPTVNGIPLDSPPPFEDYSASNPAPGNSNGVIPSESVARPQPSRHFLGGVLPLSFLPRRQPAGPPALGGGQSGVFANLSARPENRAPPNGEDGPEWANEDTQKDAPPSYQTALRDAVPPYWDTTVVLPSSSSPFGPLSSSISGDEILIDGMASGNLFGFAWNLLVSVAFQFVGFLLTYVLHTTHAAKHGSRAGLGITLIFFALKLHKQGVALIRDGHYPNDWDIDPVTGEYKADLEAESQLQMGIHINWPMQMSNPWQPDNRTYTLHSLDDAKKFAHSFNHTLMDLLRPPAEDVGRSYDWFSFMLMVCGWFLLFASIGGWWRVKRFERKLKEAQRESERAQAAARREIEGEAAEAIEEEDPNAGQAPGPTQMAYYTAALTQFINGAREIREGFHGRRGRPINRGDALFQVDESETELLEAQGYMEPMASASQGDAARRAGRGLWGTG